MRELRFRGKSLDGGKWVVGSIVHQTDYYGDKCDRWFILEGDHTNDYDIDYPIEVHKETIGQYTGTKDRNGNEIYEGDILLPPGEAASNIRLVVVFEKGCWTLKVPEWGSLFDTLLYEFGGEEYMILGNIYDNPSMLEKEETK